MNRKHLLVILLPFLAMLIMPFAANAATITACTFNKNVYHQGETGYITVDVYNDKEDKIRVTELTATIDYYYTDENVYVQTFYSDETLPVEIQRGETGSLNIPFSLPNNIAAGYTEVYVRAKTELWNNHSQAWFGSEHPTSYPVLYVESPYKDLFQDEMETNEELQQQLHDLQGVNDTTTSLVYIFGITTAVFAAVTVLMIILSRKARVIMPAAA